MSLTVSGSIGLFDTECLRLCNPVINTMPNKIENTFVVRHCSPVWVSRINDNNNTVFFVVDSMTT